MRSLAVLILSAAIPAWPQACEPAASTRAVLEQLQVPDDAHLPAAERQEIRLAAIRKALAAAPSDVFLNEAYQRARIGSREANRGALITEYEALLIKHPDDPAYLYLAATAETGRKTKEALANLQKALKIHPDFGLPHIRLAEIYLSHNYENPAEAARHLDRFAEACPQSVRAPAYLRWSKDTELIARVAARLRKNVSARTDSEAVAAYPTLWSLEAALHRSDAQAENQVRLKQDLDRLFGSEFKRNSAWIGTIQATYFLDHAPEGVSNKARAELAAIYPNSGAALSEELAKALGGSSYPSKGSPEQVQAFWHHRWQAALPLVRKWPASQSLADTAARAIALDASAKPEEVAEVMALYLKAIELDPDGLLTSPPESITVSQALMDTRKRIDDVPALVLAGLDAANRETSPEMANDVNGRSVAALQEERDMWSLMGFMPLAEAYVRLGRQSSAKDILLQVEDKLHKMRPPDNASSGDKFRFAEQEAHYWYLRGLYAEKDNHKLDALVDYRNALSTYPPRRPAPDRRDEVMEAADRLWKELGGSTQGWNDWASHSSIAAFYAGAGGGEAWSKLAKSSPDLVLTDSMGKTWKPADLAGKTTFVTVWASWCGPCRAELPYVEKLYQQFRDNDKVAVLAFNVDDDPKLMNTALQELKVNLPSIAARDFAYSIVAQMALPANWIIAPSKTEMFRGDESTYDNWLASAAKAIEQAAAK